MNPKQKIPHTHNTHNNTHARRVNGASLRGGRHFSRQLTSTSMEKIAIKRAKKRKAKTTSGKEKVLAALGVGGTLLGAAGAVAPKSPQTQFVRTQDASAETATSKIKETLKRIFGVPKAQAEGLSEVDVRAILDELNSLNRPNLTAEERARQQELTRLYYSGYYNNQPGVIRANRNRAGTATDFAGAVTISDAQGNTLYTYNHIGDRIFVTLPGGESRIFNSRAELSQFVEQGGSSDLNRAAQDLLQHYNAAVAGTYGITVPDVLPTPQSTPAAPALPDVIARARTTPWEQLTPAEQQVFLNHFRNGQNQGDIPSSFGPGSAFAYALGLGDSTNITVGADGRTYYRDSSTGGNWKVTVPQGTNVGTPSVADVIAKARTSGWASLSEAERRVFTGHFSGGQNQSDIPSSFGADSAFATALGLAGQSDSTVRGTNGRTYKLVDGQWRLQITPQSGGTPTQTATREVPLDAQGRLRPGWMKIGDDLYYRTGPGGEHYYSNGNGTIQAETLNEYNVLLARRLIGDFRPKFFERPGVISAYDGSFTAHNPDYYATFETAQEVVRILERLGFPGGKVVVTSSNQGNMFPANAPQYSILMPNGEIFNAGALARNLEQAMSPQGSIQTFIGSFRAENRRGGTSELGRNAVLATGNLRQDLNPSGLNLGYTVAPVGEGVSTAGTTVGSSTSGSGTTGGTSTAGSAVTPGQSITQNQNLSITTADTLPQATVGQVYSLRLQVTGGSGQYLWQLGAGRFPPGLALNPLTGEITGTPLSAGTYTFTLVVNDLRNSVSANRQFTLEVKPAGASTSETAGAEEAADESTENQQEDVLDLEEEGDTNAETRAREEEEISQREADLRDQISVLENRVAQLSSRLSNQSSSAELVAAQREITQLREQISQLTQAVRNLGQTSTVRAFGTVYESGGLQMPAGYAASGGTQESAQAYWSRFNQNQNQNSATAGRQAESRGAVGQTRGRYVVKKGDTLWAIAKKYYGNGKEWRKILEANPNCLSRPGDTRTLRVGFELVIPE